MPKINNVLYSGSEFAIDDDTADRFTEYKKTVNLTGEEVNCKEKRDEGSFF